jgi:uncharacterized membrane protein
MHSVRTRLVVIAAAVVTLLALTTAAQAQTPRSRAFYRSVNGITLSGSVDCADAPGGTFTVTTDRDVVLVAAGAISPDGTFVLASGSVVDFDVFGAVTLTVSGDGLVESEFDNSGCGGHLDISTNEESGSSTISARNRVVSSSGSMSTSSARSSRLSRISGRLGGGSW